MRPIVLIYPPDLLTGPLAEDLRKQGVRSPISIEHSLIDCGRCGKPGWIGPRQLAVAKARLGEIVCYYCILRDPQLWSIATVTLNPDIDKARRRTL